MCHRDVHTLEIHDQLPYPNDHGNHTTLNENRLKLTIKIVQKKNFIPYPQTLSLSFLPKFYHFIIIYDTMMITYHLCIVSLNLLQDYMSTTYITAIQSKSLAMLLTSYPRSITFLLGETAADNNHFLGLNSFLNSETHKAKPSLSLLGPLLHST